MSDDDDDDDDRAAEDVLADVSAGAASARAKGIANLPFMKRAAEASKQKALDEAKALLRELGAAGNDEGDDDDDVENDMTARVPGSGRMQFTGDGEEEDHNIRDDDDDDDDEGADVDAQDHDDDADAHQGKGNKQRRRRGGLSVAAPSKKSSSTKKEQAQRPSTTAARMQAREVPPTDATMAVPSSNAALVADAFAADADAAKDFAAAKRRVAEEELEMHDKALGRDSLDGAGFLPGWGTWGGEDGKPTKLPTWVSEAAARAKKRKDTYLKNRADARMSHAIITERADKKLGEMQVSQVPYGYGNSAQVYDAVMRQPLGRDWNSDASFRNFTRPAVLTKKGVAIQPLKVGQVLVAEGAVMGNGTARSGVDGAGAPLKRDKAMNRKRAAAEQLRRKDVASKSLRRPFLVDGGGDAHAM